VARPIDYRIVPEDVFTAWADVLALKYADAFYGADLAVAEAIGYSGHLEVGKHAFVKGTRIEAPEVLFVGVGPLRGFRYEQIRKFGQTVMETVARERPQADRLPSRFTALGMG
jgi:hypothetical protein